MSVDDDGIVSGLLPDGQQWTIAPLLWGNVQLSIGPVDALVFDRTWHYVGETATLAGLADWIARYEDVTEPTGWFRAIDGTGRRRRDGDPAQEYIQW